MALGDWQTGFQYHYRKFRTRAKARAQTRKIRNLGYRTVRMKKVADGFWLVIIKKKSHRKKR